MSVIEDYYNTMFEVRSEYAKRYPGKKIFNDGVLRPDLYFMTGKPKIVMLLKEGIDDWSLVDKIKNTEEDNYHVEHDPNNGSNGWADNIIRTVYYVQNKRWLEYTRNDSVTGLAYINVKKVIEGKTISDDRDLNKYAKDDKDLLCKQIIACVPDIVFCCQRNKKDDSPEDIREVSSQLIRLETILHAKRESIPNIPFAYALPYFAYGRKNKLIAVSWSHPSRYKLSKDEMRHRLIQLSPWIERAVKYNNRPCASSEGNGTV